MMLLLMLLMVVVVVDFPFRLTASSLLIERKWEIQLQLELVD
jgi:hypothetical protein